MFSLLARALTILLPLMAAKAVAAVPPKIPIAALAAQPTLSSPILSPDGQSIAARVNEDGICKLLLLNADNPTKAHRLLVLGKVMLADVKWAGNKRLVVTTLTFIQLGPMMLPTMRTLAIDLPSGQSRTLDPGQHWALSSKILHVDPAGATALIATLTDLKPPSVKRVDLATGVATVEEKSRKGVWDWYVVDAGVVRAGIAYDARRWTMWYRDRPGEPLKALKGKFDRTDDSAVDRITFGNRSGEGAIITNEKNGRFAVYHYDYRTATIGAPIFEHPSVDISDINVDPVTGSVRGVRYTDDRRRTIWLDTRLAAAQRKIDKALPGAVNDIEDLSRDGKRMLIWSGGASDPGTYYLLDLAGQALHPLVKPRELIDSAQLAQVQSVSYLARDGLRIPAYLTLPPGREPHKLPLIMMPHGGPFARDEWEYDPLVQLLANRGYAVLQPQFRGSTGYGKEFVVRGHGEWGRKMQDDLDDGVDWLAKGGRIDAKRVCIVGASYGGYAALWGAVRNPERYRCAASMAGVSDLPAQLRANRKSFAAPRYFREWRTMVAGEGKTDLAGVSPLRFAKTIRIPLLIAHGVRDDTVDVKQSQAMVNALTAAKADVISVFYKEAGHGFSDAKDLADYLTRLEAFLAKTNPS